MMLDVELTNQPVPGLTALQLARCLLVHKLPTALTVKSKMIHYKLKIRLFTELQFVFLGLSAHFI